MKLRGTVAAVTGAASGIGRSLALALAQRGVHLALADRNAEGLVAVGRACEDAGVHVSTHVVDVADEGQVRAFADEARAVHGAVDVLVNNAGVSIAGTVAELATDEIAWLMNVNFWGVVHGTKAFLPLLLARPAACIVNVSSVFGLWGPPGQAAYAASKFAVRGFSEALRAELAATNVRVVTVHPGGIRTAIATSARVARAADAALAAQRTKTFDERFLTTAPEIAAAAIVEGIERGRERVLIGADARTIDLLTRLFPTRAARLLTARAEATARAR